MQSTRLKTDEQSSFPTTDRRIICMMRSLCDGATVPEWELDTTGQIKKHGNLSTTRISTFALVGFCQAARKVMQLWLLGAPVSDWKVSEQVFFLSHRVDGQRRTNLTPPLLEGGVHSISIFPPWHRIWCRVGLFTESVLAGLMTGTSWFVDLGMVEMRARLSRDLTGQSSWEIRRRYYRLIAMF